MTAQEISEFLNNAELNLIADLFLSCCGFGRTAVDYRLIRNAVLLFPHCSDEQELYSMLSDITEIAPNEISTRIATAVAAVEKPVHLSFNERFAHSDYDFGERRKSVEMPALKTAAEILSFLGATLTYIVSVNYSA